MCTVEQCNISLDIPLFFPQDNWRGLQHVSAASTLPTLKQCFLQYTCAASNILKQAHRV